ncbi:AAEL000059-PA [Aedes aegypti]|uniref:CLIP domain-containing serine protease n=1 Tax=Aedes aegypti TaxID=7159 RepID=Q0C7A2_AEDAE|nr:AAEL000059-PA [Aedes aegypti]
MSQSVYRIVVLVALLSQVFCSELPENCINPAGKQGKCVPIRNCRSFVKLLQRSPIPPEDIRFLKASRCSEPNASGSSVFVCCPKVEKLLKPPYCGVGESDRLIGGQLAFLSEFPWTALIEYRRNSSDETRFRCGATLISSRYVLTAAHCAHEGSNDFWKAIGVRLGEHDLDTTKDCEFGECAAPPITVGIERIIVHENYNPRHKEHTDDIALIRLDREIQFSEDVAPICLPVEESVRNRNITGTWDAKSVGWGVSESAIASRQKLKSHLAILDPKSCRKLDKATLRDTQFCTEMQSDRETCTADDGGSLVIRGHLNGLFGHNFLYGVASFGKDNLCGAKGEPAVFTDVTKYIEWIESNIEL